jgi:hypothetical protein
VFALAALMYGADGILRRHIEFVYAGGAALVGALWWMFRYLHVTELQAYALSLGVLCLLIGWSEMRRGRTRWYLLATVGGLAALLGSAFYQSLVSATFYALLLLAEGVVVFGIGIRLRSRLYIQAGILALFVNGLAQFGPAFVNLERWIQIGTIGSILLLGGLAALFRRQRLLEMRQSFTSEWKTWRP